MPYSEGIGMSSLLFGHLTTGSSEQQYRSGFSVFREKEITQYIDICQSIIMHLEHGSYRIVKTLVVQNQINEKTSVNRVELQVIDNHVSILQAFKSIRLDLTDKIVRIYDFRKNSYTPIHAQNKIPLSWISGNGCDLVLVKLGTMLQSITSHSGSASHKNEKLSESSTAKKERSKERVIFEVIQIVKKWRELHVNKNSLKKMSLTQAAKILGMPKKSLDDYFYQLRLGQKYGFDFQTHLFDRMGVLRTYLKNLKGHTDIDKYQKHPKNLRIMDKFDDLSELFFNGSCNYPQARHQMQLQVIEQDAISQKKLQEELEASKMNDFRSEFQYLLDEKDPFLVGDFNFKKKMMQVDQDQIFH